MPGSRIEDQLAILLGLSQPLPSVWPQKVRSGLYLSSGGASGIATPVQNRLYLAPFIVPSAITVVEANVNVTTAAASNVLRAGVYADDGNGAPSYLAVEFGATFDLSATGIKTQAISSMLTPGMWWVGGALQGGTGASVTGVGQIPSALIVNNGQASAITSRAYFQDGVSGALPAQFTFAVTNAALFGPLVTLKVQ